MPNSIFPQFLDNYVILTIKDVFQTFKASSRPSHYLVFVFLFGNLILLKAASLYWTLDTLKPWLNLGRKSYVQFSCGLLGDHLQCDVWVIPDKLVIYSSTWPQLASQNRISENATHSYFSIFDGVCLGSSVTFDPCPNHSITTSRLLMKSRLLPDGSCCS